MYEKVAATLATFDIERLWSLATIVERKTLVDELIEAVHIYPDHLTVKVHGAPELNVLLSEVGLKESATSGVGGTTQTLTPRVATVGGFDVAA